MKLGLSNTVKLITTIPIITLILLAGYEGNIKYNEYKTINPLKKTININKNLENLYFNIIKERDVSATYFGSAGIKKEKELKNIYIKVDKEINNISKYNKVVGIKELLKNFKKIKEIRLKINNLDIDFKKMYFDYYTNISNKIYNIIKSNQINTNNKYIIINNINKLNELKMLDNISLEKGFVSNILEEYIPVAPQDINKMQVLFNSSKYTAPQGITKQKIKKEIQNISKNINKINSIIDKYKNSINFTSETGEFLIKDKEWLQKEDEKIKNINKIINILEKDTEQEITKELENIKLQLIVILITLFLAFIFLILSQKVSASMKKNIKNLSNIFEKMAKLSGHEEKINLDTEQGQKEAFGVIEDAIMILTETKDKAIKASETKSMFLANMSHEIRTPLNGIVGFTELLTHTTLDEEQLEFVETIEKSSENLLNIINDILDLSKIESNKIEIEEIIFDPLNHFEQAAELYGAKAAEKNINLSFYIDPNLSTKNLKGDPTRLKEVIINLMSNAVKFTPKNGNIKVNIKEKGITSEGKTKIYFEIKDSGIGIEKDKLGSIFTAFSQADTSTTRKFGGTGLGLTISSKFIELMDGKLEVTSDYGKGTTFFFTVEFETIKKNKKIINSFKNTEIIFNHSKTEKEQNHILTEYMNYMGMKVITTHNKTQIEKNLKENKEIKAILLDYDFILEQEPENVKKYTEIKDIPIFLIIKPIIAKSEKLFSIMDNVKNIFEPVSLTKINKSFKSIENKLLSEEMIIKREKAEEIKKEKENNQINKTETKDNKKKDNKKKDNKKKEVIGHVLVAEDNIINQKLILKTLEKFNITADLADNGQKAVEARKQNDKYEIIFMDINMPIMTGIEATKEILKWEEEENKTHIPIIAVTANAIKGDKEKFIEQGMDDYITKPLKRQDIEAIMKKFLGEEEFENFIKKGN